MVVERSYPATSSTETSTEGYERYDVRLAAWFAASDSASGGLVTHELQQGFSLIACSSRYFVFLLDWYTSTNNEVERRGAKREQEFKEFNNKRISEIIKEYDEII